MKTSTKHVLTGVSLPGELLARIDQERGDVNRSRFIQRSLEKSLLGTSIRKANLKEPLQTASKVVPEGQSAKVETKPPVVEESDPSHEL